MIFGKKYQYNLYKPRRRKKSFILRIIKFFLLVIILYELITGFLIFTLNIDSNSMEPLMQKNNKLLIFKPSYNQQLFKNRVTIPGIGQPQRGDVVIYYKNFEKDYPWYLKPVNSVINFFSFQKKELKTKYDYNSRVNAGRIVGVPGDTIKIKNNVAHIRQEKSNNFVTEFEITKDKYNINISSFPGNWDSKNNPFYSDSDEIKIGEGFYFIMGDNRELYVDSRNSGLIPKNNIKGKAVFRYWPLKRINVF